MVAAIDSKSVPVRGGSSSLPLGTRSNLSVFWWIIAKYSKYGGQDIGEYGKFTRPYSQIVGAPDVM